MCPSCNRAFRCLPSSRVVYDSKFCEWQAKMNHPREHLTLRQKQMLHPSSWRQVHDHGHPWKGPAPKE